MGRTIRYPDQCRDQMYLGEGRVSYKLGLLCVYGEEGERSCLNLISHVQERTMLCNRAERRGLAYDPDVLVLEKDGVVGLRKHQNKTAI